MPEGLKYEIGTNVEFIVHMAAETHMQALMALLVVYWRQWQMQWDTNGRVLYWDAIHQIFRILPEYRCPKH